MDTNGDEKNRVSIGPVWLRGLAALIMAGILGLMIYSHYERKEDEQVTETLRNMPTSLPPDIERLKKGDLRPATTVQPEPEASRNGS